MGMRLKAGIGLINLSMLVKTTYNPGIGLEPYRGPISKSTVTPPG